MTSDYSVSLCSRIFVCRTEPKDCPFLLVLYEPGNKLLWITSLVTQEAANCGETRLSVEPLVIHFKNFVQPSSAPIRCFRQNKFILCPHRTPQRSLLANRELQTGFKNVRALGKEGVRKYDRGRRTSHLRGATDGCLESSFRGLQAPNMVGRFGAPKGDNWLSGCIPCVRYEVDGAGRGVFASMTRRWQENEMRCRRM